MCGSFSSSVFNHRTDEYGGSFENRMRFPLEVLRAVRKQVGPDFPILFRYSMEEFMPGGIDMEQAVRIAKSYARTHGSVPPRRPRITPWISALLGGAAIGLVWLLAVLI